LPGGFFKGKRLYIFGVPANYLPAEISMLFSRSFGGRDIPMRRRVEFPAECAVIIKFKGAKGQKSGAIMALPTDRKGQFP